MSENNTVLNVSGNLDISGDGANDEFIYLRLVKLSEDEQGAQLALAQAQEKLTLLQKAIVSYVREKESTLTRLGNLAPDFVEDATILKKQENEKLKYFPLSFESLNFKPDFHVEIESLKKFQETKEPSYLLDWEKELAVIWGDSFPGGQALISITNTQYKFTVNINKEGRIEVEQQPVTAQSTQKLPAPNASLRASCQNNMKQLGLVFKMYENEQINQYIPGGFRQTYPEYLSDLKVLICPGLNNGKVGYQILYPASNAGFWKEIFTKVEGLPADGFQYQSAVPWLIEKESCTQENGRNVLFADGHVEHIKDKNWDTKIGPYLEYAYN